MPTTATRGCRWSSDASPDVQSRGGANFCSTAFNGPSSSLVAVPLTRLILPPLGASATTEFRDGSSDAAPDFEGPATACAGVGDPDSTARSNAWALLTCIQTSCASGARASRPHRASSPHRLDGSGRAITQQARLASDHRGGYEQGPRGEERAEAGDGLPSEVAYFADTRAISARPSVAVRRLAYPQRHT